MAHGSRLNWKFVAGFASLLALSIVFFLAFWPTPKPLPIPPPVPDIESRAAVPSTQYEARNDVLVLRAALARFCKANPGYIVISTKPIPAPGDRSPGSVKTFPSGLSCPGIKFVSDSELESALDRAFKNVRAPGSKGSFDREFPGAAGTAYVSLPAYSRNGLSAVVDIDVGGCFRCGAGWRLTLSKTKNGWAISAERPRWIA